MSKQLVIVGCWDILSRSIALSTLTGMKTRKILETLALNLKTTVFVKLMAWSYGDMDSCSGPSLISNQYVSLE
jgi:hypothetical protein